jgi:hypothetical protein
LAWVDGEKHKHFPKRQTGCLKCFVAQASLKGLKEFIEVYINNQSIFVIVYQPFYLIGESLLYKVKVLAKYGEDAVSNNFTANDNMTFQFW